MDKYLCRNDLFSHHWKQLFTELPVKGQIYTLRDVITNPRGGTVGWVFEELHNPLDPDGIEYNFRPTRFTKIDPLMEEVKNTLMEEIFAGID